MEYEKCKNNFKAKKSPLKYYPIKGEKDVDFYVDYHRVKFSRKAAGSKVARLLSF